LSIPLTREAVAPPDVDAGLPVGRSLIADYCGEYSSRHWTGWPDASNAYGSAQPTQPEALMVILNLKPAS
jgi:peptide/nickel transport system substrate-binding protein